MTTTSPAPGHATERSAPWWRDAICYEIYVRSFAGSGVGGAAGLGDLPGITARLDHLVALGVDALWLTPFYRSPQHDHGYDVADYRDVDPRFGTLDDVDRLLAAAHRRGLKVIVDIVPNHSSEEHLWFRQALADGPGSAARDRYVFRPGRGEDGSLPPNNWPSVFGGPAWERVPDGQWYLHLFDKSQPDFNWHNPEVREEFERTLRFWLDRGVDGFRIDVAHGLFKQAGLPDVVDPTAFGGGHNPVGPMWDQPEVHEIYRAWRRILDSYPGDRMAVAEAWAPTPEATSRYSRSDELQQAFNFHFLTAPWAALGFRSIIELTLTMVAPGGSATWVLGNHDVVRPVTRYGGGAVGLARARAATLMMLALPGSAYVYQGEELGLEQVDVPIEAIQDPEFRTGRGPSRDGCRVPLPWDGDRPPYDFAPVDGQPWLPQPADWARLSVASQAAAADSTLAFYRAALATRRGFVADGWAGDRELEWLDHGTDVLAFRRGPVTVMVNFGDADAPMPAGEVLIASGPVGTTLPADTAVWLR